MDFKKKSLVSYDLMQVHILATTKPPHTHQKNHITGITGNTIIYPKD